MPTEVTATIMIGPLAADSSHGPSTFCPSHVLVLMEGARATWVMQRCPELERPSPTWFIRPSSPEHLLAAAVLGYVAAIAPEVIADSASLGAVVSSDSAAKEVRVHPLDDALAAEIFTQCSPYVHGAVTALPGSTVTEGDLRVAAGHGFLVAVARDGDKVSH